MKECSIWAKKEEVLKERVACWVQLVEAMTVGTERGYAVCTDKYELCFDCSFYRDSAGSL